jgi:hypothetical protein
MPSSKGWRDPDGERSADPHSVGDILSGLLAASRTFARGVPLARLLRSWADVVGERLAPETSPVRLEAGVLTVAATSGPWGAQARFLSEQIRKRADDALGGGVVKRVTVVVSDGIAKRPKPL